MRQVLKIDGQRPDEFVIAEASSILGAGGVVAYPTETFYGLGADGHLEDAIKKIFVIKGRSFKNPISVIIGNATDVRGLVEEMIRQESVPVRVVPNEIYDVIGVSDIVVVASGTATLETALLGTPMVIIYKVSPLSYYVGTKVINVTHIGLANLIAGKTIVPELIQDDANPDRIAAEVIGILADESRMQSIKEELNQIREKLGSPGASEKAARLACDML